MSYATATGVILALYAAVIVYFVWRGARRTKSLADYAVGNVRFSPWMVGLSLAAASTSAATFIINPGFIALYGISGVLAFAVFMPLGKYLSLVVMTKRFRRQGATVNAISMAQWIGKRFQSPAFAFFFAVLSLLLVTFMVLICVGMTKVVVQALGIGEMTALAGIVIFVFGYMMFGGANAMVYTNSIQAFMKLIVAFLLLGSGYSWFSNGIHGFITALEKVDPVLVSATNPASPLFRDWFELALAPFIIGIAIVCQPHIITKSLLLREEKDVNKYLIAGIGAEIIFFSVVFAGLFARLAFPDLMLNGVALKMDGIIPAYVVHEFPVWIGLVVVFGLIASGLATFEGLIQSLSTTITSDIVDPLAGGRLGAGEARAGRLKRINAWVIAGLAVLTFFLSRYQLLYPTLSVGIFAQVGVYAFFSAAFIPVVFGIFLPSASRRSTAAAAVVAVVVHFAVYFMALTPYTAGPVRNPAVSAALAIVAAAVTGVALHLWENKNFIKKDASQIKSRTVDNVDQTF